MTQIGRREFLQNAGRSALGVVGSAYVMRSGAAWADARRKDKPNIVFILIDDLGWRDLSCYGSTFYDTPNIDSLAGQGMKFTDAYAAAPLCSATRASIMTGKYPGRLNITGAFTYRRKPTSSNSPPSARVARADLELVSPALTIGQHRNTPTLRLRVVNASG